VDANAAHRSLAWSKRRCPSHEVDGGSPQVSAGVRQVWFGPADAVNWTWAKGRREVGPCTGFLYLFLFYFSFAILLKFQTLVLKFKAVDKFHTQIKCTTKSANMKEYNYSCIFFIIVHILFLLFFSFIFLFIYKFII
jgi:hypothetical protein